MTVTSHPRPWYCIDELVEEYLQIAKGDGDLRMLKALKLIRSILVIAAISAISLYALYLGADATLVAVFSLPSLAAYAGVEAADYASLLQAYREARTDNE